MQNNSYRSFLGTVRSLPSLCHGWPTNAVTRENLWSYNLKMHAYKQYNTPYAVPQCMCISGLRTLTLNFIFLVLFYFFWTMWSKWLNSLISFYSVIMNPCSFMHILFTLPCTESSSLLLLYKGCHCEIKVKLCAFWLRVKRDNQDKPFRHSCFLILLRWIKRILGQWQYQYLENNPLHLGFGPKPCKLKKNMYKKKTYPP